MDLYGLKFIYMRFTVIICVADVSMSLVWPASLPQALFVFAKKGVPRFVEHVNSGNCQNCVVLFISSSILQI